MLTHVSNPNLVFSFSFHPFGKSILNYDTEMAHVHHTILRHIHRLQIFSTFRDIHRANNPIRTGTRRRKHRCDNFKISVRKYFNVSGVTYLAHNQSLGLWRYEKHIGELTHLKTQDLIRVE